MVLSGTHRFKSGGCDHIFCQPPGGRACHETTPPGTWHTTQRCTGRGRGLGGVCVCAGAGRGRGGGLRAEAYVLCAARFGCRAQECRACLACMRRTALHRCHTLRRDCARCCHICTGTGPTPATLCAGTGQFSRPHAQAGATSTFASFVAASSGAVSIPPSPIPLSPAAQVPSHARTLTNACAHERAHARARRRPNVHTRARTHERAHAMLAPFCFAVSFVCPVLIRAGALAEELRTGAVHFRSGVGCAAMPLLEKGLGLDSQRIPLAYHMQHVGGA
jgi:hypothetical protein